MYSHTCVHNRKHTTIPDLLFCHINPLTVPVHAIVIDIDVSLAVAERERESG
jgi:hypothetical protein